METFEMPTLSDEKLNEVDQVYDLVKKMNSNDETVAKAACQEASTILDKKKNKCFDKSIINKTVQSTVTQNGNAHETNVDAFMAAVSKDADERAARRANLRQRATKVKDRANAFFKAGDLKRAVELYSRAIEISNDWDILYTNRALAYLRLGESELALKDCDTALVFYPQSLETTLDQCQSMSGPERTAYLNRIAKTHFHRGKAFMSLDQPQSALDAYDRARCYSESSMKKDNTGWPVFLSEYVIQAQASLAAQADDAKAEMAFKNLAIGNEAGSLSSQLLCLLAQLARLNQPSQYYGAGLRKLGRLFANAPRQLPTSVEQCSSKAAKPVQSNKALGGGAAESHRVKKKKSHRNKTATNGKNLASCGDGQDLVKPVSNNLELDESLTYLQSVFRVKNGFTLLDKEVNAIAQIFHFSFENAPIIGVVCPTASDSTVVDLSSSQRLDDIDRLAALINLVHWLIDDCDENQRMLVDKQANLVRIVFGCMELSDEFVNCLALTNEADHYHQQQQPSRGQKYIISYDSAAKQRLSYLLASIRSSALSVVTCIVSRPSGRQVLLDRIGAGSILHTLANNFSNSLPSAARHLALANQSPTCTLKAAQILEHLVNCPRFLTQIGSTPNDFHGLLDVVECLMASNTNQHHCLATLLDSLATACQDSSVKIQFGLDKRKLLIGALADCMINHSPLLNDATHSYLVGCACRLLHNIYVGQPNRQHEAATSVDVDAMTTLAQSHATLIDHVLTSVGTVLDQPGHGPELRAIAVALAGRLLPKRMASKEMTMWFGERDVERDDAAFGGYELLPRARMLLAILDSCCPSSLNVASPKSLSNGCQPKGDSVETSSSSAKLTMHLIGGCIRCLAAGSKHSMALRYAIGDDKCRVRRLARFVRVRLAQPSQSSSCSETSQKMHANCCPAQPRPRDEPLAGNVCLVLQHCAADTPLAEHLEGTSVIYDLLSLIQESKNLETKRNAAILIGNLAQSSQVHRDRVSQLDGFNVLMPFNSWSSSLGY